MKILSIGNFFNPSWDGSQPDEEHIAGALERLGHEVYRWQRDGVLHAPAEMNFNPDFILVAQWYGYSDILHVLIKEFRKPVIYWAFDYQADGQEWHERLIKSADLYLSKRIADSKYPNWQYLSQNFAPEFLDKPSNGSYLDIDVLFTGSYLDFATERNETLKAVDENFNLVIHSVNEWPGFKDVRPPVMDAGLPELYNRAKVVLSIDHTLEAGYHSDRNAQIMCCGVKPLFRYVPLSEQTFHNYVDYFYSIDDCIAKIEHKLELPGMYDIEPYNYAQANLKVKNRVEDLLTIVRGIL